MNCDGVRELLSAYVDGELSSGELLRVEQHLRRCPLCAEEVDALRQAIALVGSLEEVELPAGFREGLRARLAQVSPQLQPVQPVAPIRPAWQRRVGRWALPAAAAAALAIATSGVYGQMGQLLTRSAEPGPTAPVNTPSVIDSNNPVAPPVQKDQPPVAVHPEPAPPTAGGGQTGTKTNPEPVAPPVAKADDAPEVTPEPAPIGETPATGGPVVASLTAQVSAPQTLPAQFATRTTVQAIVPDPTAGCNALKSAITGAECTIKEAGRLIEVRFQVPVQVAADALVQVQSLIGEGATIRTEGIDRASQLSAAYDLLSTIQEDTDKLMLAVATANDSAQREVEEAALARKMDEGRKAVEDYNRLYTEVNSQLFVINLQKQGQ